MDIMVLDNNRYLVDCLIKARCIALGNKPFFVVAMKKKEGEYQMALYDDSSAIIAHTE